MTLNTDFGLRQQMASQELRPIDTFSRIVDSIATVSLSQLTDDPDVPRGKKATIVLANKGLDTLSGDPQATEMLRQHLLGCYQITSADRLEVQLSKSSLSGKPSSMLRILIRLKPFLDLVR